MERERDTRNNLFSMGEPFREFQGFGGFGSLFGGRDPFDDPFFTRPFGSMFQSGVFGPRPASGDAVQTDGGKGPVIEELDSDDEVAIDKGSGSQADQYNHQKQAGASSEPSVEHPDDDDDDDDDDRSKNVTNNRSKNMSHRNLHNKVEGTQTRSFSASSSKVTYGGVDGAYYTSTRTRRMGTDGAVIEEAKEADRTTGQAAHRISRGINDKGHSVTRKLTSDGNVDVLQTLHNLNEDELAGFEQAWKGKGQMPSWSDGLGKNGRAGSGSKPEGNSTWGGWALPSIGHAGNAGGIRSDNSSAGRTKKVVRINIE